MGRRLLTVLVVCVASCAAGVTALAALRLDRELSVGTVRLFADPGHRGALDIYVPLVDWGVRFEACACPCGCVSTSSPSTATQRSKVAREGAEAPRARARQHDARDAMAAYLRNLSSSWSAARWPSGCSSRSRCAVRAGRAHRASPRPGQRRSAIGVAIVVLLPPRGDLGTPEYYAHGPDIPRALRAVEAAQAGANVLGRSSTPARRPRAAGRRPQRAAHARRPPADHRRLRPAQQRRSRCRRCGASRAATAAVLRRRPDRSRLAARVPAREWGRCAPGSGSCSCPATTTPTPTPRSWPATARSCSPSRGGCCAAGASGRWWCGSPACAWPATAIRSGAGVRRLHPARAQPGADAGRAGRSSPSGLRASRTRSTSSWCTSRRWRPRRSRRCVSIRPRIRSCSSSVTRTGRRSTSIAT